VTAPARRLASYTDLAALGDGRFEVLSGEIVEKASPSAEHARTQRAFGRFVGGPFDDDDGRGGPGGWWILTEVDIELEVHEIVRPDLAGFRRERGLALWGKRPLKFVPDWICEVLSPSDERRDRVHKASLYARSGVSHYWLAAPAEGLLEAFELRDRTWVRLGAWQAGDVARIAPFEAIEIDVSRLFPPLPP
jgi:Uma2 family endonuclease